MTNDKPPKIDYEIAYQELLVKYSELADTNLETSRKLVDLAQKYEVLAKLYSGKMISFANINVNMTSSVKELKKRLFSGRTNDFVAIDALLNDLSSELLK